MKLLGTINLDSTGSWQYSVYDSQQFAMYIDGALALTNITVSGTTVTVASSASNTITLTKGIHTVEVDVIGSTAAAMSYAVSAHSPTGSVNGPIPLSILDPAYGLKTSSTDADGKKTSISYTSSSIGAELGLPIATTVDPSGLALTTTTSYEPASTTTYFRRLSTTLPRGNATTYAYYSGTAGPLAAVCGVTATTLQGGQLQSQTDPAPSSGAAAREQQFVYDAAGRQVGRRVGSSTAISSAPWQCTSYDARGRILSQTYPAVGTAAARTVTYSYSVGGNPLIASVIDSTNTGGTITAQEDLLGRAISYTDALAQTTTIQYDQAGRVTSTTGPTGSISYGFNANSGAVTTVSYGGAVAATASYDPMGRLASVAYLNNTTGTLAYDVLGRQSSLVFKNTSTGALITGDQITDSLAGRITSELEDINGTSLTNPNPAGSSATDYTYDGAGRLTQAYLPGSVAAYGYAVNPSGDGCSSNTGGANTNRTRVTTTPTGGSATVTDSCYNTADQLTKSITGSTTTTNYAYDAHGNQTADNGTTLTWDSSDRLAKSTTAAGVTTTYTYDALDRVINRTTTATSGTTTVLYSYSGFSDTPALEQVGSTLQQFLSLPGGVTATVTPGVSVTWSYPDMHGNVTAVADNSGAPVGTRDTYDPWGAPPAGQSPVNNAGSTTADLGAFGGNGKVTDTASGIVIMGARAFNPAEGRFLSVDPVPGGCANAYVYTFGDPLTQQDLTGRDFCKKISAYTALRIADELQAGADESEILDTLGLAGGVLGEMIAQGITYAGSAYAGMLETAAETAIEFGGPNPQVGIYVKTIWKVPVAFFPIPIVNVGVRGYKIGDPCT